MINRTTTVVASFFILFMFSGPMAKAQYPFVTACQSTPALPASVLEMTTAKVERLFQGSSVYPEGQSTALIIQPAIILNDSILPKPSESGRPMTLTGTLQLQILSPGDQVVLQTIQLPLFGKAQDAEGAMRQAIHELEANPDQLRSTYDAAREAQEIVWNDCEVFLADCQAMADKGKLSAALVKLGSSPPGTPCSTDVDELWVTLLKKRKKSHCDDMVAAAKTALKEGDDHRALQLTIAADPTCQPEFWKGTMADLATRITADNRADRRMVDKSLEGSLREEDRKNKLYALLFEQVLTERKAGK